MLISPKTGLRKQSPTLFTTGSCKTSQGSQHKQNTRYAFTTGCAFTSEENEEILEDSKLVW